ncbi:HlyD family efflux transporter periplasmic adaptor subunit [Tuwongella immobilis]|uniref:Uncharacterized protein n=1 Tax=Tuwongella immobilis TaxID=692036 RepID=A0A6C2YUH4_9BACT|nr:HlyD family efflux transporter periplasmic adaptor subunit [Tuwongella immobilis]VIP04689.1 ABC-transporter membrane fusion protein OS=Cyanobium sp. PCC 7001 GN=CPCC7001_2657 PE=4 SV=1: HlyD_2 [Tuwongella immobilis]VTS06737.1 ABC-transporter membrane fusion protein OS=Cyanobium sp. PCC 7001 GN=CPCC7001_2657 PE=4 SV=1: HlyD_2 [Tuwongella immobilis]
MAKSMLQESERESADLPRSVPRRAELRSINRPIGRGWWRMLRRGVLIIGIAATLVVAAIGWQQRERLVRSTEATVSIIEPSAAIGPVATALGELEPTSKIVAVSGPDGQANSRIAELRVQEGESVAADQVLAVLDSEPRVAAECAVLAERLTLATRKLEQTQIAVRSTTLELQARLKSAGIAEQLARSKQQRRMALTRRQAISQEEMDDSQAEVETAVAAVASLNAMLARYAAKPGEEPLDVQVARTEVAVAEANLREGEARYQLTQVRAPFAGVVLQIHRRTGESLGQQPLLSMGALQMMRVRAEVYETDLARVRMGQAARFRSPALLEPLVGRVTWRSQWVQKQGIVEAAPAANTDARIVEVWVDLAADSGQVAAQFVGLQGVVEFLP